MKNYVARSAIAALLAGIAFTSAAQAEGMGYGLTWGVSSPALGDGEDRMISESAFGTLTLGTPDVKTEFRLSRTDILPVVPGATNLRDIDRTPVSLTSAYIGQDRALAGFDGIVRFHYGVEYTSVGEVRNGDDLSAVAAALVHGEDSYVNGVAGVSVDVGGDGVRNRSYFEIYRGMRKEMRFGTALLFGAEADGVLVANPVTGMVMPVSMGSLASKANGLTYILSIDGSHVTEDSLVENGAAGHFDLDPAQISLTGAVKYSQGPLSGYYGLSYIKRDTAGTTDTDDGQFVGTLSAAFRF